MSSFVPSGYLSFEEVLDLIGRDLFPEWTGEELAMPTYTRDAQDPVWLETEPLRERKYQSSKELRRRLEAGEISAEVMDPYSGFTLPIEREKWRTGEATEYLQ